MIKLRVEKVKRPTIWNGVSNTQVMMSRIFVIRLKTIVLLLITWVGHAILMTNLAEPPKTVYSIFECMYGHTEIIFN